MVDVDGRQWANTMGALDMGWSRGGTIQIDCGNTVVDLQRLSKVQATLIANAVACWGWWMSMAVSWVNMGW